MLENIVLELWDTVDFSRPHARMLYTGHLRFFWNADETLIYGRVARGWISETCTFETDPEIVIWNTVHGPDIV